MLYIANWQYKTPVRKASKKRVFCITMQNHVLCSQVDAYHSFASASSFPLVTGKTIQQADKLNNTGVIR